jgi:hypothetical protein
MASIVNNLKYGENHKVQLKDKPVNLALFKKEGYRAGQSIFLITRKKVKPSKVIELAKGNKSILLKDDKNKVVLFEGTESSINGSFNHFTNNAKSKTNVLTEIKELVSMYMFENYIERGKVLKEEEVRSMVKRVKNTYDQYFDSFYYESAVKQLNELKKFRLKKGYMYERQKGPLTFDLYKVARKLTNKLDDNWNPGDVWLIKKGYKMNTLTDSKTANQLNSELTKAFNKRDIVPISLKQVERQTATSSIIDPSNLMRSKLDLDLKFDRVDLSESFNNFIVISKSGFAVRVGFKASATTLNVSLEGRFIGAGFQTGAVDAKAYTKYVSEEYNYNLRGGAVDKSSYSVAQKELKEMFSKYKRLSNTIENYDQAIKLFKKGNKLVQDRFANLMSYMYSFLIKPKKFEEHMKFNYFTSKKMSTDSSIYLIIQ